MELPHAPACGSFALLIGRGAAVVLFTGEYNLAILEREKASCFRGENGVLTRRMLRAMGKRDVGCDAPTESNAFLVYFCSLKYCIMSYETVSIVW